MTPQLDGTQLFHLKMYFPQRCRYFSNLFQFDFETPTEFETTVIATSFMLHTKEEFSDDQYCDITSLDCQDTQCQIDANTNSTSSDYEIPWKPKCRPNCGRCPYSTCNEYGKCSN